MTETVTTRRVRVTIEGDAHDVSSTSDILRVAYGPHHSVMVHKSMDNVTVEDVAPARTWTDGDVVVTHYPGRMQDVVRTREGGEWHGTTARGAAVLSDTQIDERIAEDDGYPTSVLRYQAGEQ